MRYDLSRLVFSPSDLIAYLSGDFRSWMDRWHLERENGNGVASELGLPFGVTIDGIKCVPDEQDDELKLIATKGAEHEASFLQRLRDASHEVVAIDSTLPLDEQAEQTICAMRAGAEYIYQGRLELDGFAGYADFLVRQTGTSKLGDHHYEVWDTKLARSLKPYFIIQLSSYSAMLEAVQGRLPENFAVVLGHGQHEPRSVRKFLYYFRSLQRKFRKFHQDFSASAFPHPGLSRGHGRWATFATSYLIATDHLSQVANITATPKNLKSLASVPSLLWRRPRPKACRGWRPRCSCG